MSRWLFLLVAAAACRTAPPATAPPAPGVVAPPPGGHAPPPPGLRLPDGFTPTRYRAELDVDPAKPTFTGAIEIDADLAAPSSIVWLHARDLRIDRAEARAGGRAVALEAVAQPPDLVALRAPADLPAGPVTIAIDYAGTVATRDTYGLFAQEDGGARYLFTQLQPTGARAVFPCVDEPWNKVPWELTLAIPDGAVALGNAPVAREERGRVAFAPTKPLPSYLVAFAVGPFELVPGGETTGGAPIRIATLQGRTRDAHWAAEVTRELVAVLEAWFGTPYPYDKLDQVAIPVTVGFSAMENPGLITYRADRLLVDASSEDARRDYVWLAAHELAHQWFGNLVTPRWWDDLWLSEAFATWMEDKAMSAFSPAWGSRTAAVVQRDDALAADGLVSARRVRQPIDDAGDIATAFDGITYGKGASVIRMFEAWIGAEDFQRGVRAFLAAHAWGAATTDDFVAALDAASPLDVAAAFRSFVEQPGAPRVAAELRCDKQQAPVVTLTQERWLPPGAATPAGDPPRWVIPVCVAHGTRKTRQTTCTVLDGPRAEVTLDGRCPAWFLPNAGGVGYFRSALSADAIDDLLDDGWGQLPPHERVLVAGDVRAQVARGELPIEAELALVRRLARDGARHAIDVALAIVDDAAAIAPPGSRDALDAWIRDTFAARARKLGFLPDPGDSSDKEELRAALVARVALAGEAKLRARALELAKAWRELPEAARAGVLGVAANLDADLRAELRAIVRAPKDAREAVFALAGLAMLRDPEEVKTTLALLLDPAVDLKQARWLLVAYAHEPRTQPVAEAFVRDHVADLIARLPPSAAADLVEILTASCDGERRAEIADFARAHFEPLEGGSRTVAQALEALDVCVARRAANAAALEKWLADR